MIRIGIASLEHTLRIHEEHSEGDRHQQEVTAQMQHHGLLVVHLDEHVAPNLYE